jgi:type II secretory pathway pseudopilin PulG
MRDMRKSERRAESEEGFILLAALFLVFLVLIALAVAAPLMARSIQRDKEVELVHRGEQYKRAIKLYYKKFGAYPTSIDQLLNTNNIRFLRKRYTDPITGKDDWRLIYFGQAKVPPMGLFGQPLTGLAGGVGGASPLAPTAGAPGSTAFGSPSSSSFASATLNTQDSSNSSESGDNSAVDSAANNPSVMTTGSEASQSNGSTPFGTSTTGGTSGRQSGAFGSTLGGGPIVGVGIPSSKASLIEYKKQKKYSQWEFVYNPIEDSLLAGGAAGSFGGTMNPNGTAGTTGNPNGTVGTTGTGIGPTSNNNGSIGPGSGSDGTTPPTGSTPQQ